MEAFDDFFFHGGRTRAATGATYYSPSAGSMVRSAQFAIRWTPLNASVKLTFRLFDTNDAVVWSKTSVRGDVLEWSDGKMRAAMAAIQADENPRELTLEVTREGVDGSVLIPFSLLSKKQEFELDEKLAAISGRPDSDLLKAMKRANELRAIGLTNEAAVAYEAILAKVPHSEAFLKATVEAQREAGNFFRARELEKQTR